MATIIGEMGWMVGRFLLVMMLLAATTLAALAKDPQDPVAMIASIYKSYMGKTEPPSYSSRKVYSRRLKALIDADEKKTVRGDDPTIDWDVFVNGQDWELSNLKIVLASRSGTQAQVQASFDNLKEPVEMIFDLVQENGGWRIDDIRAMQKGNRWDMAKVLSKAPDAFPDQVK
ncbi:MAG: DUF3828 domain-containing protein [Hyphomicrobiales bacterium]|nr:DUF3828 domain-containing protein [Hyphomicrobiales bacterium]